MNHGLLFDIVVLLLAAVICVPISQRLGFGSVLGYLAAGIIIGPGALGIVTDTENLAHVSELGVVFLLFIIGLELEPRRLWSWRTQIFGMGSGQVMLAGALLMMVGLAFQLSWQAALVLGLAGAMSSTAIATQVLQARNLLPTRGGSSAFSILLFQDMAVIPLLAVVPLLAGKESEGHGVAWWMILAVVAAIVAAGQYILRPILRAVASVHQREIFTALSLLLVTGLAGLMQNLGVSMALGAFLGGVLLATSEYRHAIETDIEPFKGLLLGLFFMSVGMSIDIPAVTERPLQVLLLVVLVVAAKFTAHALVAFLFRMPGREIPLFAILLSQVGEFAFVVAGMAAQMGMISPASLAVVAAAIGLSMASTSLLLTAFDKWWAPRLLIVKDMSGERIEDESPEVIIAGFGRVGQIVARLLYANRIRATVLDHDPEQIEMVRQFGFKVYYGDATRLDLLEAAGARRAKVLVVAIDDMDDSLELVDRAREHFPHLKLVARARNMAHVYALIDRDICTWERETFDSSLRMGTEVMKQLGYGSYAAVRAANKFRDHNLQMIFDLHAVRGDQAKLVSTAKQAREDLEKMFAADRESGIYIRASWDLQPEGRDDTLS